MALSACVTRGRSRTPSARVLRQLIVNARSLSKVAFTLLASFRGLAVSPCASFERLTLYHSRVIKQADILRVVLQSRPDLRCIECHRRRPPPLLRRNFCSMCAGFAATRPPAAVSLSRLASAISMARNSRSTSRFQLCRSPNENAEVPAAFRNGHFECELSVGISLAACSVTLMAGSTCVRRMLAQRMESSGPLRQIQPVRGCGRAH